MRMGPPRPIWRGATSWARRWIQRSAGVMKAGSLERRGNPGSGVDGRSGVVLAEGEICAASGEMRGFFASLRMTGFLVAVIWSDGAEERSQAGRPPNSHSAQE